MNTKKNWTWVALLTIIMETITCFFRFCLSMESTRDTSFISHFTFGFRIHHGYIGLVLFIIAILTRSKKRTNLHTLMFIIGLALVFSDIIHHFLVLWPIAGDPHFDLFYD